MIKNLGLILSCFSLALCAAQKPGEPSWSPEKPHVRIVFQPNQLLAQTPSFHSCLFTHDQRSPGEFYIAHNQSRPAGEWTQAELVEFNAFRNEMENSVHRSFGREPGQAIIFNGSMNPKFGVYQGMPCYHKPFTLAEPLTEARVEFAAAPVKTLAVPAGMRSYDIPFLGNSNEPEKRTPDALSANMKYKIAKRMQAHMNLTGIPGAWRPIILPPNHPMNSRLKPANVVARSKL